MKKKYSILILILVCAFLASCSSAVMAPRSASGFQASNIKAEEVDSHVRLPLAKKREPRVISIGGITVGQSLEGWLRVRESSILLALRLKLKYGWEEVRKPSELENRDSIRVTILDPEGKDNLLVIISTGKYAGRQKRTVYQEWIEADDFFRDKVLDRLIAKIYQALGE